MFLHRFIKDPQHPSNTCNLTSPLSLGLYIHNFVYFSKDPKVEQLFEHLLHQRIKVEFTGLTEWVLGIHFLWHFTKLDVAVHLNQSEYATNLVKQFSWIHGTPLLLLPLTVLGFPSTQLLTLPMTTVLLLSSVKQRPIKA